jgi:hypothetical protein
MWTAALVVATLSAQSIPILRPYEQLRRYLDLTNAQVLTLQRNNAEYQRFTMEKQRRMMQVRVEIAEWTAKDPIDPMQLGIRYAEIEAICRHLKTEQENLQKRNIELLTVEQRAKLRVLEEAEKLLPVIAEAHQATLLAGVSPMPVTGALETITGTIAPVANLNGSCPSAASVLPIILQP